LALPYGSVEDPYCYAGGQILKNKQQLQSADELERFENNMVAIRFAEPLPNGIFDPAHYRAIHHHLFQDVYDWAGQYRTIRIAKRSSMFCFPEHIAAQMELLFAELQHTPFTGAASRGEFAAAAARFLGELNAIHPFREGNGRTQLTFLFLLGHRAGHRLDMARVRAGPMLAAMVASFGGKLGPLEDEIALLLV
jgi:cell filamentation protein